MELTFEKLIRFDLVQELETSLLTRSGILTEFLSIGLEIQSADRFIKDSPSFPGSTDKIIRDELISAIGATLAIEGTNLRADEIEESLRKADLNETLKRTEQEAENSRRAYRFIIDIVRNPETSFIYDEHIIKQIHKYFTENLNYLGNKPGDYRGDFATTFGVPRREGLCRNRSEVQTAMTNFVRWLNDPGAGIISTNIFAKGIMAHYYLTEIHPFADGNGRTARALEALILYVNGVNNYCFWSLANFWSTHRDRYIVHLGNIRNTCNPSDFLLWGMKGYLGEIEKIKGLVLKKVKQLMLLDYAKYLLATKRKRAVKLNQRIIDILRLLVQKGKIPLDEFQSSAELTALYRSVSTTTRYRDIKKIVKAKLARLEKDDEKFFIEPNFQVLDFVSYNV